MKIEQLGEYANSLVGAAVSAATATAYWVVRRILTDTRRLSLLEQRQEMQHREIVSALEATRDQVSQIERANDQAASNQAQIVEILDRMEKRGNE